MNMSYIQNVFEAHLKQSEFAELVGISQQAVSDLKKRGIIEAGQTAGEWLLAYCAHLREIAAGRMGSGELDLATERAKLARAQQERIEMQNAITRREYGPIDAMEQGLCDCMAVVASKLDTVPGKLRIANNRLTADDLDIVSAVIADVRNDIATMDIDWFGDEEIEE